MDEEASYDERLEAINPNLTAGQYEMLRDTPDAEKLAEVERLERQARDGALSWKGYRKLRNHTLGISNSVETFIGKAVAVGLVVLVGFIFWAFGGSGIAESDSPQAEQWATFVGWSALCVGGVGIGVYIVIRTLFD